MFSLKQECRKAAQQALFSNITKLTSVEIERKKGHTVTKCFVSITTYPLNSPPCKLRLNEN